MKGDIETKLKAIVELQNYFMRELTPFEKDKILNADTDAVLDELKCKCGLTILENKHIFEILKKVISTYFTAPKSHWADLVRDLKTNNDSEKIVETLREIADAILDCDHSEDGYSEEKDDQLDKYFDSDCSGKLRTYDEYLSEIQNKTCKKRTVEDIFDALLNGKELELDEDEFDAVADKFFSEDRKGCWSLSYTNGKVRLTYEK